MKNISILGVTGSIGTQALEVIKSDSENLNLYAISANTSYEKIIEIINVFHPKYVAVTEESTYIKVKEYCNSKANTAEVLYGMEGLNTIATLPEVDMVLTSVVGMIGLVPTLNAIKAKKDIALANKETLVVGGQLVIEEARKNNANIIPVDSEHGAIFQCLQGNKKSSVDKIIITASGGPFRGKVKEQLVNATYREALRHPKWNMGRKISIDSATLMNKGLEVIEAHWLFNMDYSDIEVVVHPQSIIHSMVQYVDGSVLAQLGVPDMKLPIQYAVNYPTRKASVIEKLDFSKIGSLTFEKPDLETFRCLKLAYDAGRTGGTMPTILNAANEVAVDLFLNEKIKFLGIADLIEECMMKFEYKKISYVEDILEADKSVREYIKNKFKV
ncbi:1-deoxy-D-xylulose-5-phosphate reductoisomerase [Clostridium omnivorum]|uniref:1-deoxy-D-xylulose 5-phosphate reductoisomerase n=1 Tax=Clostridium omnivorum TaxID=1604902 RepID=A0ABQ5NBZ9_9CLOT|nr:1-deoxy-D-xylulose-5-phosphate reductoisomerase [Clostridium sp. E14]GLC32711.1 1-deoxy-D-xylulose 5-phosphate reductoisomerase [Clostridium sp. E14]